MKKLIVYILAIPLISCAVKKDANDSLDNKSTIGIVRDKSMQDCGFLIEVKVEDNLILLEPQLLPEKHNIDGMAINFEYTVSRRPSSCAIAMPITINKIID